MKEVVIDKDRLIQIVKDNQKDHEAKFEEAWGSWRDRMIDNFEEHLRRLKDRKQPTQVKINVNLVQPENHSDDYERALKMLQLHMEDTVTLDEQDFAELVQNDWGWERAFASTYNVTTGKRYGKFGV